MFTLIVGNIEKDITFVLMKSGVYIITCTVSGKHYIGYSKNVGKRLTDHKNDLRNNLHGNNHLQDAFNLYGIDNFTFDPLEYYPKEIMASFEHWWCNMLNTHNRDFGYNIRPTSPIGKPGLSKECKAKIAFANIGKKHSQETKDKISKIVKGRPVSKYTRSLLSIAHSGKIISDETREQTSNTLKIKYSSGELVNPFLGKRHSYESFRHRCREIVQIEKKTGKIIEIFVSTAESIRSTGIWKAKMAADGERKTAGNFLWKWLEDITIEEIKNKTVKIA